MISENDSLDHEPQVLDEAMVHAKNIGATHILECLDSDGSVQFDYALPDEDVCRIEHWCWKSSFHVNVYKVLY